MRWIKREAFHISHHVTCPDDTTPDYLLPKRTKRYEFFHVANPLFDSTRTVPVCPYHFTFRMVSLTAIKIHDDCMPIWEGIKIGHKYRYVIFTFSEDLRHVVVDKAQPPSSTYNDFLDDLPPRDVRYAVYDYDYSASDGTNRNKLVFIVWAPDIAPVKRKMLIASTKVAVKNALSGISLEIQATDDSEIQESVILAKCQAQTY
jgi:cofilin